MKQLALFLVCLQFACSPKVHEDKVTDHDEKKEDTVLQSRVANDIKTNLLSGDMRFYITSERNPTIPGIEFSAYEKEIRLCGIKKLKRSTDSFDSQESKNEVLEQLRYAKLYNQEMLFHCKQNIIAEQQK